MRDAGNRGNEGWPGEGEGVNVYRERPKPPRRTPLRDEEVASSTGSTASFTLWAARIMVGIVVVISGMMAAQPWHGGEGVYDWLATEAYNVRCCVIFGCSAIVLAILSRPRS